MLAIPSSSRAASARQVAPIVAAVLAVATLAAGTMLLMPSPGPSWASSAGAPAATAAMVPVGIAGDSAVSGDPSVPSAASVFKDKIAPEEEPIASF